MKVEQGNLPIEAHRRYAIDQQIKNDNPLIDLLAQAKARPSNTQQSSTISSSHLAALNLNKESTYSWTSFSPPPNLNLDPLFSFEFFSALKQAADIFSSFTSQAKGMKYKGDYALKELFSLTNQLQDMFLLIQSKRIGLQQG
jgi:hypothetical protein